MLHRLILFFLLTAFTGTLKAEIPIPYFNPPNSVTSTFIERYDTLVGVYLYGIRKYNQFSFFDKELNKEIRYSPNEHLNLGVGFNYRWLGIGLAFNSGSVNNDDHIYGNTKSIDLQVDMYPKGWMISTYLQWYKSFYWSNPGVYIPDWSTGDSLQIRPDLRTFAFGTSAVYALNHTRFSYKAPFLNTEFQKQSAGSFLLGGSFSIYQVRGNYSLIPELLQDLYAPEITYIAGVNATLLGAVAGYSYTHVFYQNFYANLTLLAGLNFQHISTRNLDYNILESDNSIAANGIARVALGFNQPKYYLGFTGYFNNYNTHSGKDVKFLYGMGKFRFFLGFRFNTLHWKKKLDGVIDYIDDQNPLNKNK